MNIRTAYNLAHKTMKQHGIGHWDLKLSRRMKNTLGTCNYKDQRISLSHSFIEANEEKAVIDVILHEIAHALTPGARHGAEWKRMCVKIGAIPEQFAHHSRVVMEYKWELAYREPEGCLVRTGLKRHRRTDMKNKGIRGKSYTHGKLFWVEAQS